MANKTERKVVDLRDRGEKRYCIIGPRMCVDFHFNASMPRDIIAGLEMHYRECPPYLEGREPLDEHCWLHGGRCWGDGTSLYATECLYLLFKEGTLDEFWPILEREYEWRLRDAFGEAE